MKTLKHILIAISGVLFAILCGFYLKPGNPIMMSTSFLILGFVIFNLIIRKSLSYKNYFTSRNNLFTTKYRTEKAFDISKALMFEKIIEVLNNSEFKLVEVDKDKYEILAITQLTFKSWGENLYISFETSGDKTIMKVCSATLFQVYSWGKNEQNSDNLLNEIESSLTI